MGKNAALAKKYSTGSEQTVAVVGLASISDFCHSPLDTEGVPCTALMDMGSSVTVAQPEVVTAGFGLEGTAIHLHTVSYHCSWGEDGLR